MRTAFLLCLAIAACSSEPPRADGGTRQRGTKAAKVARKGTAKAAAFTPSSCRPAGEPKGVVESEHAPRDVTVGQIGDRTAVLYTDDGRGKLVVVDASGRPVAPAADLDATDGEDGGSEVDLSVVHGLGGLVSIHRRLRGASHSRCEIIARRVDATGAPGAPVVVATDACASSRVYATASRGSELFVAHTKGAAGDGLELVRVTEAGLAEPVAELADGTRCEARRLGAAPDGCTAVWSCDGKLVARKFDESGLPLTAPLELAEPAPVWTGDRLLQSRVRQGSLEVRDVPLEGASGPWRQVDVTGIQTASLGRAAGRLWGFFQRASRGFRLAALGPDGSLAGAPTDVGGFTFDADGRHGIVASIRGKQILLQPLVCD